MPAFSLPPLLADRPGLAQGDLAGQPHVVNVFASWCVPCRAEHPVISDLAAGGAVQKMVAINYKDKPADARRWLAELGNPYARIGSDESGRVSIDWGVYGVRETYLVDGAGRPIRYRHVGPLTAAVVRGGAAALGGPAMKAAAALLALAWLVLAAVPAAAVRPDEVLSDPALERRARAAGQNLPLFGLPKSNRSTTATRGWPVTSAFWCAGAWRPATMTRR